MERSVTQYPLEKARSFPWASAIIPCRFCGKGTIMCLSQDVASMQITNKKWIYMSKKLKKFTPGSLQIHYVRWGSCMCSWWHLKFVPKSGLYLTYKQRMPALLCVPSTAGCLTPKSTHRLLFHLVPVTLPNTKLGLIWLVLSSWSLCDCTAVDADVGSVYLS